MPRKDQIRQRITKLLELVEVTRKETLRFGMILITLPDTLLTCSDLCCAIIILLALL